MKKVKKSESISTFLGVGVNIEGLIEFQDTIRLDGHFKGKVVGKEGTLIVGEKAEIDAEIEVGAAIVMGQLNGTICARTTIEIFPPAKVTGDLIAPSVAIEKGVIFNGNCQMSGQDSGTKSQKDAVKVLKSS
jgi:cytoskeletal protein CcmA (bactofilin family)